MTRKWWWSGRGEGSVQQQEVLGKAGQQGGQESSQQRMRLQHACSMGCMARGPQQRTLGAAARQRLVKHLGQDRQDGLQVGSGGDAAWRDEG